MKSKIGVILAAAAAVMLFGAALALKPGAPVHVEIPEHLTARQTADLLGENRVVHSELLFRAFLKITRYDRRIKSGTYTFRIHEYPWTLIHKLTLGLSDDIKVTIPEGLRASQIAEKLAESGVIAFAADFTDLVRQKNAEGELFPSTYLFPPHFGPQRAVARMIDEYKKQIEAAYNSASPAPAVPLRSALIVASIVEREAVLKSERPIIAAVYLNRIKKRMPLQADPTVQYALGTWKQGLTKADLKAPSPYNTYLHSGLPPGPICSPGLESFKAVLAPADTKALYFVADGKGGHVFSETNSEHSQARRQYKRELKKKKALLKAQKGKKKGQSK